MTCIEKSRVIVASGGGGGALLRKISEWATGHAASITRCDSVTGLPDHSPTQIITVIGGTPHRYFNGSSQIGIIKARHIIRIKQDPPGGKPPERDRTTQPSRRRDEPQRGDHGKTEEMARRLCARRKTPCAK